MDGNQISQVWNQGLKKRIEVDSQIKWAGPGTRIRGSDQGSNRLNQGSMWWSQRSKGCRSENTSAESRISSFKRKVKVNK